MSDQSLHTGWTPRTVDPVHTVHTQGVKRVRENPENPEKTEEPEKPQKPQKSRKTKKNPKNPFYYTNKKERTRRLGGFDLEGILSEIPSRAMEDMSDRTLRRFSRALRDAVWDKKAFCVVHECTREEAVAKGALGGFKHGENGAGHFYFEPKSGEFTAEQIQLIDDHTACCYNTGQPCAQQLDNEWDGDPCECAMGSSNGSYCYEVGIGPDTFEEECDCFAIKPICSRIETGVRTEFIHTVEQFKDSVGDFALLDADSLVKVGAFLKSSMQGELRYGSIVYKPYPKPEPEEPEEPEVPKVPKAPKPNAPNPKAQKDYENLFRVAKARQTQLLGGHTLERLLKLIPSRILKRMSGNTLEEVSYQLRHAIWDKKAFCTYSECTREEAIAKGDLGGYTAGALGTHYFFFEPKSSVEFTDNQRQLLSDHTACCFMSGQPCACDEDDDDYEPCTHQMGDDLGSYCFQMNLGPKTFRSECDVDLIEPKWVRTLKSGNLNADRVDNIYNIYSMAELKRCLDLNTMGVDDLVKVAAFLQNPVGELSVDVSLGYQDDVGGTVAYYTPYKSSGKRS
tara:strand:- start:770 stop:2467 length:1698 start_codon:yes stop_codon:yes gene_type:complete